MDYIIIEQTKEYKKRISYNPTTKTFSESEHDCIFLMRDFTHPYGWLKGTGTPPGKHLDIFMLSQKECSLGDELPIKVVGVFIRNDGDHKLIGISPERDEIDFSQLTETEKGDLHRLYPRVGDGEGWFGAEKAREVIMDFNNFIKIQVEKIIYEYEHDFFRCTFCNDINNLETRFADDFYECGVSGIHTRADTINSLSKITADRNILVSNFKVDVLSDTVIMARYEAFMPEINRRSFHLSIWKKINNDWKIFYHQATKLNNE